MTASTLLSRIRVVLSHPTHPGNIGAAARAMKTMGLSRLILVRPKRFPDPEARARSANALDVLESATVCEDLGEALRGTTLSFAVSARLRELAHPPLDARSAAAEAVACACSEEVAFLFGNETTGLSNDEVLMCNRLACIPSDPGYSSLNLASAVQVIAYECRMSAIGAEFARVGAPAMALAPHQDVENFLAHLEQSLQASGFLDPGNPRKLMERMRRLFLRVTLEVEEVSLLRGMLSAWDKPRSRGKNS